MGVGGAWFGVIGVPLSLFAVVLALLFVYDRYGVQLGYEGCVPLLVFCILLLGGGDEETVSSFGVFHREESLFVGDAPHALVCVFDLFECSVDHAWVYERFLWC